MTELKRERIDFNKIAEETGVRKGKIVCSSHSGWVVIGHPDIDMICIETPYKIGDSIDGVRVDNVRIDGREWVFESIY